MIENEGLDFSIHGKLCYQGLLDLSHYSRINESKYECYLWIIKDILQFLVQLEENRIKPHILMMSNNGKHVNQNLKVNDKVLSDEYLSSNISLLNQHYFYAFNELITPDYFSSFQDYSYQRRMSIPSNLYHYYQILLLLTSYIISNSPSYSDTSMDTSSDISCSSSSNYPHNSSSTIHYIQHDKQVVSRFELMISILFYWNSFLLIIDNNQGMGNQKSSKLRNELFNTNQLLQSYQIIFSQSKAIEQISFFMEDIIRHMTLIQLQHIENSFTYNLYSLLKKECKTNLRNSLFMLSSLISACHMDRYMMLSSYSAENFEIILPCLQEIIFDDLYLLDVLFLPFISSFPMLGINQEACNSLTALSYILSNRTPFTWLLSSNTSIISMNYEPFLDLCQDIAPDNYYEFLELSFSNQKNTISKNNNLKLSSETFFEWNKEKSNNFIDSFKQIYQKGKINLSSLSHSSHFRLNNSNKNHNKSENNHYKTQSNQSSLSTQDVFSMILTYFDESFYLRYCQIYCLYSSNVLVISDRNGFYPLHHIIRKSFSRIIKYLTQQFSYIISLTDSKGKLPLHHAILNSNKLPSEVILLLANSYPYALLPNNSNIILANQPSTPLTSSSSSFHIINYAKTNCTEDIYLGLQKIFVNSFHHLTQQEKKSKTPLKANDSNISDPSLNKRLKSSASSKVKSKLIQNTPELTAPSSFSIPPPFYYPASTTSSSALYSFTPNNQLTSEFPFSLISQIQSTISNQLENPLFKYPLPQINPLISALNLPPKPIEPVPSNFLSASFPKKRKLSLSKDNQGQNFDNHVDHVDDFTSLENQSCKFSPNQYSNPPQND